MNPTPEHILESVFGYREFRSNQKQIIEAALRGEDTFVLMPSGGGKSLCYQIPAMLRPGTGIVVSPLISLMKDQVDALTALGVRAATYNSSLDPAAARRVLSDLRAGLLDLLYLSPERAVSDGFLDWLAASSATGLRARDASPAMASRAGDGSLRRSPRWGTGSSDEASPSNGGPSGSIALIAIDEAHCISQWGHDFRPEYVALRLLRERFPRAPLMALTATADPHTRDDIREKLGLQEAACFVSSFDRPNIRLRVVEKRSPHAQLLSFLAGREEDSGIIYCSTRRRTDDLAAYLRQRGIAAASYHAGLSMEERNRTQEDFLFDRVQIVAATVAFGMGIDKTNVRFVVHWDLPQHLEGYYQEIGRSGRDGLPAEALLLFGWEDVPRVRALIEAGENEERVAVEQHKLSAMVGYTQALSCRRRALLGYLGETMESDCGNCDVCLDPPEVYDATVDAQKALSSVYRLGERFGVGHVVDVLRGSQKKRITELGHDRLSTFGIGADLSADAWRSLLQQLVHLGYLRQDMGQYPTLKLTSAAGPLLRGTESLMLARPRAKLARIGEGRSRGDRGRAETIEAGGGHYPPVDQSMFERLRTVRRLIAEREYLPAYVVFHDSTLREMAALRPQTPEDMLLVSGVGQRKLEKYGSEFLEVLREGGDSLKDNGIH